MRSLPPSKRCARLAPLAVLFVAACATVPSMTPTPAQDTAAKPVVAAAPQPPAKPAKPVRIGLALGGGAARGFAHVGVIKTLEAQGINPDIVVGTSAGAVVGALYAAGNNGFELQKLAHKLDEGKLADWSLPDRGVLKGEGLQKFVNDAVGQRPIEALRKPFAAVATDLASGQSIVFRTGNTGMAVRASATVPGVFKPVTINGHDYVDGGLSSLIPVHEAKQLGADVVIAVDISAPPRRQPLRGTLDVLLQTFTIMGNNLARFELKEADVVIRPQVGNVGSAEFVARHDAILEGEKAAQAALPQIRAALKKAAEN